MIGPWDTEPNDAEWVSPGGSRCLIARSVMGTLAGYVALSPGHPWEGRHIFDVPARTHGGCTWSAPMEPGSWWIGFDCGHASYDTIPLLLELSPHAFEGCVYRDFAYVKAEVTALALQAELAAKGREVEA